MVLEFKATEEKRVPSKSEVIVFRCTEADAEHIYRLASKAGVSVSAYIRCAIDFASKYAPPKSFSPDAVDSQKSEQTE